MAGGGAFLGVDGDVDGAIGRGDDKAAVGGRCQPGFDGVGGVDRDVNASGGNVEAAGDCGCRHGDVRAVHGRFGPCAVGNRDVDVPGGGDFVDEDCQSGSGNVGGSDAGEGGKVKLRERLRVVDTVDIHGDGAAEVAAVARDHVRILRQGDSLGEGGEWENGEAKEQLLQGVVGLIYVHLRKFPPSCVARSSPARSLDVPVIIA